MEKPATEVTMAKERGINMVQFQGFKTKAEAKAFVDRHGGMLCYEKSEIEQTRVFPMSPEGLEQIRAWLEAAV